MENSNFEKKTKNKPGWIDGFKWFCNLQVTWRGYSSSKTPGKPTGRAPFTGQQGDTQPFIVKSD